MRCRSRCRVQLQESDVSCIPQGWRDGRLTRQEMERTSCDVQSSMPLYRYNFINVAVWENEDLYWKAYEKSAAPAKTKLTEMGCDMVRALYCVEFEY